MGPRDLTSVGRAPRRGDGARGRCPAPGNPHAPAEAVRGPRGMLPVDLVGGRHDTGARRAPRGTPPSGVGGRQGLRLGSAVGVGRRPGAPAGGSSVAAGRMSGGCRPAPPRTPGRAHPVPRPSESRPRASPRATRRRTDALSPPRPLSLPLGWPMPHHGRTHTAPSIRHLLNTRPVRGTWGGGEGRAGGEGGCVGSVWCLGGVSGARGRAPAGAVLARSAGRCSGRRRAGGGVPFRTARAARAAHERLGKSPEVDDECLNVLETVT